MVVVQVWFSNVNGINAFIRSLSRPDKANTLALRPDKAKILASRQYRPQGQDQKVEVKCLTSRPCWGQSLASR